jgi:hypothetical protein
MSKLYKMLLVWGAGSGLEQNGVVRQPSSVLLNSLVLCVCRGGRAEGICEASGQAPECQR